MSQSILTTNSIKYTLKLLFNIANPKRNLKYSIYYNENEFKVIVNFKDSEKRIIFYLVPDSFWFDLINSKRKIKWIRNSEFSELQGIGFELIPILFNKDCDRPFIDIVNENEMIFNFDIISSSFFMLSRWEETVNKNRDKHGRFSAYQSTAYKQDFLNIPIVDVYGLILRNYLKILFNNIDLGFNEFSVKLSHDIDEVRRFSGFKRTIKTIIGGDLIKRKNILFTLDSIKAAIKTLINRKEDPYIKGILELANISKEYNLNSSFYFKTSEKSNYDSGYKIDNTVRNVIGKLQKSGFEIGFHPGYTAYENYNVFIKERKELEIILGHSNYGGRHHYLRFEVPNTWRIWEKAGFKYDSTVGYADYEGFRCGTCHPFQPYDIDYDRELNIIEIPLIVMEATLNGYRNLTPQEGLENIIDLATKCKNVEGVFTLLWHNETIYREWKPWFNIYKKAAKFLSSLIS